MGIYGKYPLNKEELITTILIFVLSLFVIICMVLAMIGVYNGPHDWVIPILSGINVINMVYCIKAANSLLFNTIYHYKKRRKANERKF